MVAGFQLVDMVVELYDGSYHDVDSSKPLSKSPVLWLCKSAVKRAKPVILEPIMKVEVIVPEKFMGDVTGNLNSKRAR